MSVRMRMNWMEIVKISNNDIDRLGILEEANSGKKRIPVAEDFTLDKSYFDCEIDSLKQWFSTSVPRALNRRMIEKIKYAN
jgi:hypothetical protein